MDGIFARSDLVPEGDRREAAAQRLPRGRRLVELIDEADATEVAHGAWADEFLTLGGRLRPIYGNDLTLDATSPAYLVRVAGDRIVELSCPPLERGAPIVRARCAVGAVAPETPGLWQFALRENARMRLARLSFDQGTLWADYELPLAAAHGPILHTAVSAVAAAAAGLVVELACLQAPDWRSAA